MSKLRSLSLFSGCLGLDLGMEKADIKAICYVDIDPVCRETIRINRPRATIFEDVFGSDVVDFASRCQVDVVIGGPPCQSFSTIGKRGFLNDKRGKAILGFIKIVEEVSPRYFVLENVPGIVSALKGKIVKQLKRRFIKMGYHINWFILNAADFGVSQSRKRFVMFGCKDRTLPPPMPVSKNMTLYQAIGDLEGSPGKMTSFSRKMQKIMSQIPEGGCWKDLCSKLQDQAMGNANRASGGLTSFYRRLSYSKPSPTLLTSPSQRATTLCHPKHTRPLSILEYKRIQGFPDGWKVSGSVLDQYRQLGNAVPVLLGKALGKVIRK